MPKSAEMNRLFYCLAFVIVSSIIAMYWSYSVNYNRKMEAYLQEQKKMEDSSSWEADSVKEGFSPSSTVKIGLGNIEAENGAEIICSDGLNYHAGKDKGRANRIKLRCIKRGFSKEFKLAIYDEERDGKILATTDDKIIIEANSNNNKVSGCSVIGSVNSETGKENKTNSYRGKLIFTIVDKDKIMVVNELSLENYLKGVVPKEVPVDKFHAEAIKAMACAARSYTIKNFGKHEREGFNLCATSHCQEYGGLTFETEESNRQIEATAGETVCYNKLIADTKYHSTCGGVGETPESVWGNSTDASLAYLKTYTDSVDGENYLNNLDEDNFRYFINNPPASFCSSSNRFRWNKEISIGKFRQLLKESLPVIFAEEGIKAEDIGIFTDIQVKSRSASGRCTELLIQTDTREFIIKGGNKIRSITGGGQINSESLQSTLFYVDKFDDSVHFYGGGWGHGVGLCQMGAQGMAVSGKSYRDILQHYYANCNIESIYR